MWKGEPRSIEESLEKIKGCKKEGGRGDGEFSGGNIKRVQWGHRRRKEGIIVGD